MQEAECSKLSNLEFLKKSREEAYESDLPMQKIQNRFHMQRAFYA